MSGEMSKRSSLIDVTCQHLHSVLSGHDPSITPEQASEYLRARLPQLKTLTDPFGKPSDASKKKVESGSVVMRDGVTVRVEEVDRVYIFAISKAFNIDEVEALILFRSFLYNQGLPTNTNLESSDFVDELVEAITPYYYNERLYIPRLLLPLFRANADEAQPISDLASEFLPQVIHDGKAFARLLVDGYVAKTQAPIPKEISGDTKKAVRWAKQNAREQLVFLEVLFWTMWGYVSCDGPLVAHIYQKLYETNLGSNQENSSLLLDEEGSQLQQDSAAMWILISIEILELERVAEPGGIQISSQINDTEIYWSSPESLKKIHELVISHSSSQFACTYLGWAFFLSRLVAVGTQLRELPSTYSEFFSIILPQIDRSYSKDAEPVHVLMSRASLNPDAGFFPLLLTLLTKSPLFVTSVAWKTGSTVTDPNAVAYRSVLKGLLIVVVELVPVELIPDFEGLVEVWIALFGRSESQCVAGICRQFWESDWSRGLSRRAILDVARSRFPTQSKPLIKLLRAMTASGFLDTDPLSTVDHGFEEEAINDDRLVCAQQVFYYLHTLPTYTQVIPSAACVGSQSLYERLPERMISSTVSTGPTYTNLRKVKLPGGTTLPVRSTGRLLSGDGGDLVVVSWQHEHSGWKLLLEILTDHISRRRRSRGGDSYPDFSSKRGAPDVRSLRLEDIGVQMDSTGDDGLVTDILDLIRSVIRDNIELTEQLLDSLEVGEKVTPQSVLEGDNPGLVQLVTMVLEEALSRSSPQNRNPPSTQLITSAISVLSALLAVPKYSSHVWLYIRSTGSLFGSDRTVGFTSAVLRAERLTGHYTMTLALLYLVRQLFKEASSSVLPVLQEQPRLQQVKEEVLMRVARFVHTEIWVEHISWKYAQLGDRFEIGRRVSAFYSEVILHSPPTATDAPFSALSQAVSEALISRATTSAVNPLISALTTSSSVLKTLYSARRHDDARRLIYMLGSHLQLVRDLFHYKQNSALASKPCLLEQSLCSRGASSSDASKGNPVDALAAFASERGMDHKIPVLAVGVLFTLCSSLSSIEGPAPTIVGHLLDPEATVASLVKIISHPYDDADLRNAVWNFITLAIDKEPALAGLFVTGRFQVPTMKDKDRATHDSNKHKAASALSVAAEMLEQWKELWEHNPQLLGSLLRFLDVVWEHGREHRISLSTVRENKIFDYLADIIKEELGPTPDYRTDALIVIDGVQHSELHEAACAHAYRTVVKAHALHIFTLDIHVFAPAESQAGPPPKPLSYKALEGVLLSEEQLVDLIAEASSRAYDPYLYDEFNELTATNFPALTLDQLQVQAPPVEREFGDDFAFSLKLLQFRLLPFSASMASETDSVVQHLTSLNLNLSLARAQTTLTESWHHLLVRVAPYLRGNASVRSTFFTMAAALSEDIANERRSGEMMANIHNTRLCLLLALLEVAWFSTSDKPQEIKEFISMTKNLRGILLSESQSPAKSFTGQLSVPFHRPLLQITYFCARHSRSLLGRPKILNANQRLSINATLESALVLVIDALRLTFDSALSRMDIDLDQDMELLVAVFEQCTRTDLNPSPTAWLTRCQETDVIRASLQLFTRVDLVGLSDLGLLRIRKRPLYAPHILTFHMALASVPAAAERLASDGILVAYSENAISSATRTGSVDVILPELPGERSPAHMAYCSMLAVVSGVTFTVGHHGQYFRTEVCGLAQLLGDQTRRTLSWTVDDPVTLPLIEEMEQTVHLFAAIASTLKSSGGNDAVKLVLRSFTSDALLLVQQINYTLTHHNHLASLVEPITADERAKYEADGSGSMSQSTSADIVDPVKRPFLARLVYRLFKLSASIMSTLVVISQAESVLLGEPEEWPIDQALIVPHSKVVLGEPTSVGTLLELGNCSVDVLRQLVDRPAGQSLTVKNQASEKALDVRDSVAATRHNLEAVSLYCVAQLAMWLAKPELDNGINDMEAEETFTERLSSSDGGKDRRVSQRRSLTLGERLKRGMTGEMAADLQALLARAKPILAKSDAILGKKEVDMTAILSHFVKERIQLSN